MKLSRCWCGSETHTPFARFNTKPFTNKGLKVRIVKCTECGTVRMFDNGSDQAADYETAYNYEKISGRHLRTISIINEYCTGKSILDIGCNTGMLLNEIKKRIPALTKFTGTDLDPVAIDIGRQKYGLDLMAGDAESLTGKFDNIVMCHTLEHIADLEKAAKTIDRLLNPGGRLFIAVPNIESLGTRYLLRFWPGLSPKYHLYYFSDHTIKKYMLHVLPHYDHLHSSSFFIWKPLFFPTFIWKKSDKKKLESQMKGDQLDVVFGKPERHSKPG